MEQPAIPTTGVISRTAEISINNSAENVFNYISDGEVLPQWLKKCGPIKGVVRTVVNKGPYTSVGANRTVYFSDGSTIEEQLTWFKPYYYYSYSVTKISSVLKHLTSLGYGQWWFDEKNGATNVRWTYTFVPKNFLTKLFLSLFLTLFYKKFMNQSLSLAKQQIEQLVMKKAG